MHKIASRRWYVAFAVAMAAFGGALPAASALPAKVALIHSNPILGDSASNVASLTSLVEEAFEKDANIVVTPELSTSGFSITENQVLGGLGFTAPYPELDGIRDLAVQHGGYAFVAIAEITPAGDIYNSVVIFGPGGVIRTQDKRGLSGWHDRGVLPFDVIQTPYGDIATMICSDSYLPDWTRIATLKGADIIVTPANWWGPYGQEEIWQTRARENAVWFLVANRWGTEVDTRFGFPFVYDMNDAPSAFIGPDGEIDQIYRAQDHTPLADAIVYGAVDVPDYRIGTSVNHDYSVENRRPEAYGEIANLYYRRDLGYAPAPGLPLEGPVSTAALAYKPSPSASQNLQEIASLWGSHEGPVDAVVLPALGVGGPSIHTASPAWASSGPWGQLQAFVNAHGIGLLVTTAREIVPGRTRESLVVLRSGQPPVVSPPIHDAWLSAGTGAEPLLIDLAHARVGIVQGRDFLFPEVGTHLAKQGVDLLLVPSSVGAKVPVAASSPVQYAWTADALVRMWKTRTNEVYHLVASDWIGRGLLIENGGGYISAIDDVNGAQPFVTRTFDTSLVRFKFLNAYYGFDLASLLEP